MTEPRQYDDGAGTAHSAPVQQPGQSSSPAMSSGPASSSGSTGQTGGEAVAGPFTLRETVIGVSVLVMFIGTILPFVEGVNLWMTFSLFFLGIGILLPVAALALLIGRRLGSKNLRVGSLSVDQFASVTAGFAAAFFFLQTVTTFGIGQFIALLGSVGFLVATIGGPHLGIFKPDFTGRPSSPAHPIARETLPAKQRAPKPVPAEQVNSWQGPTGGPGSATPAPGASAGPNSAGYSAGYAVAGHAAGQQAATQHYSAPAAAPAAANTPEPASEAGAPSPDQSSSDATGAEQQESKAADAPSGSAPSSDANSGTAPSSDANSDEQNSASDQAPHAPTMAQPRIEGSRPGQWQGSASGNESQAHPRTESISATREAEADEPVVEAFWFAVGTPRVVADEHTGAQLFVLQPGDWEVGIEDRGHEFLVQDKRTGRIGVMRDLRNIERAPREG